MSFERLIRPDMPEAQTSQHNLGGAVVGWLPAIISKIESSDDPEGLGRIRAQCDFMSPSADLPNSWNGWIWVGETYTNNGKPGGSHRPIQEGSLAALLPMNGDATQMLFLYAIHNKEDRPNPLFDRSKGVHGTHSANDVFSIKDDPNAEKTDAYPTGVSQQVSRAGDVIAQTKEGARTHLQADGTNRMENKLSSSVLSKAGDVTQRSAGDASSKLGADGKVTVKAERFDSEMKLSEKKSDLTGPTSDLSQQIKKLKSLIGGNLGKMGELLGQLESVANQIGAGGNLGELAHTAQGLMGKIDKGLGSVLEEAGKTLEQIGAHGIEALGQTLMPQVEKALASGLPQVLPQIESLLGNKVGLPVLNEYLQSQTLKPLSEKAEKVLNGLRYSPQLQAEYVLSQASEEGYDAIKNVSGLGLLPVLGDIQQVLTNAAAPPLPIDPALPPQPVTPPPDYLKQVVNLLPQDMRSLVQGSGLGDMLNGKAEPEKAMEHLLGSFASGTVKQAAAALKNAKPLMEAVPNLKSLMEIVMKGGGGDLSGLLSKIGKQIPSINGIGSLPNGKMVQQAIEGFTKQIAPMLEQATKSLNKLMHSVNQEVARAGVSINNLTSELRAKLGKHRVFADEKGAGVQTPFGGMSFGKGGGLMSSVAPMLMKVLGKESGSLSLHPDKGASLEGLDSSGKAQSSISAHGNIAEMKAGAHSLLIKPEGVFLNDINVPVVLGTLTSRMAALELLIASPPPTPVPTSP